MVDCIECWEPRGMRDSVNSLRSVIVCMEILKSKRMFNYNLVSYYNLVLYLASTKLCVHYNL